MFFKEIQDKLHDLLARSEDFDGQMCKLQEDVLYLTEKNEELMKENVMLKSKLTAFTSVTENALYQQELDNECDKKMAELRVKLESVQKTCDDNFIAREIAEKELQKEKQKRVLAQKERDAYSAAYEASLKHFEKWATHKLVRKEKTALPQSSTI